MNGMVQISVDAFIKFVTATANLNSLERYVNATEYSVDKEKIAAICGFELKDGNRNADV